MKTTAPKELGILVIAGVFGIIGGGVALVAFGVALAWSVVVAGAVAVVVAIALWLGWREPAVRPMGQGVGPVNRTAVSDGGRGRPESQPGGARTTEEAAAAMRRENERRAATAAAATTAAGPSDRAEAHGEATRTDTGEGRSSTDAADAHSDATEVSTAERTDGFIAEEPAALDGSADMSKDREDETGSRIKPSAKLAGQEDLASRKGAWKYEKTDEAKPEVQESRPASTGTTHFDGSGAAAATEGVAETTDATAEKPATLDGAREGGPDNLKEIKGIGPKLETMLHEMGIFHFDQIAGWSDRELAWVDEHLEGFKGRASRDEWVGQAKVLATGGDTEFSKKVDRGDVY